MTYVSPSRARAAASTVVRQQAAAVRLRLIRCAEDMACEVCE
jgi:hypothetical protein